MPTISMRLGASKSISKAAPAIRQPLELYGTSRDDFQVSSAIYVTNDSPHEVLGYVSFTYTFHVWGGRK